MSDFDHTIREAAKLAATPEGKQLSQLLLQIGGTDLQKTLEEAAMGDYRQIQKTISALMQDPQARQILEKLGGFNGQ